MTCGPIYLSFISLSLLSCLHPVSPAGRRRRHPSQRSPIVLRLLQLIVTKFSINGSRNVERGTLFKSDFHTTEKNVPPFSVREQRSRDEVRDTVPCSQWRRFGPLHSLRRVGGHRRRGQPAATSGSKARRPLPTTSRPIWPGIFINLM